MVERSYEGARRDGGNTTRPRPWQRSFRCAAVQEPVAAPVARYEDFVALHRGLSTRSDIRRMWWCGIGAAMVVAGLVFAAVLVCRGLLGVSAPVFAGAGTGPEVAALMYAACAALAALQATALLHVLVATVPRPVRAFAWIGGPAVLLATLLPLAVRAPLDAALGTAAINLASGTAVVVLLVSVATVSFGWPERY